MFSEPSTIGLVQELIFDLDSLLFLQYQFSPTTALKSKYIFAQWNQKKCVFLMTCVNPEASIFQDSYQLMGHSYQLMGSCAAKHSFSLVGKNTFVHMSHAT